MRRLTLALLSLTAVLGAVVPVSAGTPTVGGAKKASMSFSFTATGPQQHVVAETVGETPPVDSDPMDTDNPHCDEKGRCFAFPFTVAPLTKGAKSVPVSAQITWPSPTSRFWLALVDVTKDPTIVIECYSWYASGGPSATVEARLPVGHKYQVWVTAQQVLLPSEQVKGVVHAPASDKPPASPTQSVPEVVPNLLLSPCQG